MSATISSNAVARAHVGHGFQPVQPAFFSVEAVWRWRKIPEVRKIFFQLVRTGWKPVLRDSARGAPSVWVFAASVLVLALAGCGKDSSLRSHIFSHVEIIGARGTGAGEFNKPRSLTCDTNDNLYVADMTGRIQKFSPEGKFLLSWQMPQTDLGKPKGMSCDREGNIVVLEPHYQRVNHFTPEGKLVHQWGVKGTNAGELTLPRAIVVDTKGRVIVSEYTLVDRVQIFAPRGERVVTAWGVPGLAPREFNRAEGVAVDARDNIYVADSCNHRIQIFSPEGKFLRAYGKAGTGAGEFSYPYDIAVDEQGRQFVCEFGNSRIQVFDRDDQLIEVIGKAGGEPGEFANPWSVALDSKGNLYVADSQNHRVQKLMRKQTPNPKSQIPNKFQSAKFQKSHELADIRWILGHWNLELVWDLGFGIWNFPRP